MKIRCDNCGAKYSIADEKVKGKVFKIRCKKCSNIIVVRGATEEGEDPAGDDAYQGQGAAGGFGDTPVWHLVIDREQVGPMTAAEVRDRFAAGEIDSETYTWREGFGDWVRLGNVDEFTDLAQVSAPAAAAPAPAAVAAPTPLASAPSEEAAWGGGPTPIAEQSWSPAGSPSTDGGGMFPNEATAVEANAAAMAAAASGGATREDPLFPDDDVQSPAGPGDDAVPMTAQRGENSVLFSLSNLQALAMGGGGRAPQSTASPSAGMGGISPAASRGNGVMAKQGSSGLIDIRALAPSSGSGAIGGDPLPGIGGFAPVVAAPVMIPAPISERPAWLLPVALGGGVVVLALIAVVVVLLIRDPEPAKPPVIAAAPTTGATVAGATATGTPATGTPATGTPATGTPATGTPATGTPTTGTPAAGAATNAAVAAKSPTAAVAENTASSKARSARRARSSRHARKPSRPARQTVVARAPEPPARSTRSRRGKDSLDDLIDDALGPKGKRNAGGSAAARPSRSSAPDPSLPETLGHSQIQSGMRRIKGHVQNCYDRFKVPGLANVQVTIEQSGRVSTTRVKGIFSGTPTGACVQAAVRRARFQKFRGKPITFTYPFVLR